MNQLYFSILMAPAFLLSSCPRGMEGEPAMFIEFSETSYDLGKSTPVNITYENPGANGIVMENPSKSLYVTMHVVDTKTQEDMSYSMGKIEVTDIDSASGQYALVEPPNEEIQIEPKSSFTFTSDVNSRLYLRPGEFECVLIDHDDEESNRAQITIEFTKESVPDLLELARDENQDYGRREWAMDWLQELYPEFKLNLSLEDDSDYIKKQNEVCNKVIYDAFVEWWNENKDTEQMEELLKLAASKSL